VDDLQEVQFKCNDVFKESGTNSSDRDEKGNIEGTVCSLLKDKKNEILERFNGAKLGGRKTRRRNKRKSKRIGKKTRGRRYKKKA
jgi:hypothetical protein